MDRNNAMAFGDEDVARSYRCRPPYPRTMYEFLVRLPCQHRRALDLGCGTGKIAHNLAVYFDHVDAVDPSLPMLRLADNGQHPNINWIHSTAEAADLAATYDLVTAGASIHWMDHEVLFSKLATIVDDCGYLTVIEGDEADNPPWQAEWESFIQHWLRHLGQPYDPDGYRAAMTAYQHWMTVAGRRAFQATVTQSIDDFIECQHSRATWSRSNLGAERAALFDTELREMLKPYATNGVVRYMVRTSLVWGVPGSD